MDTLIDFCAREFSAMTNHDDENAPAPTVDSPIPKRGEWISPQWSFQWIDPKRIEAGEHIVPARIKTEAGRQFAALHLILNDLSYALECLVEAESLGVPSAANLHSKALIFSAVVAYARPFKTGVRDRLEPSIFSAAGVSFDTELHDYLMALRDKHIAHSVNDFERCEATAVIVGTPETGWRDGSGIGVMKTQIIGLSLEIVQIAIRHIAAMVAHVSSLIEQQRIALYEEFKAGFAENGKWEMAPMFAFPDRTKADKRRKK